MKNKRHSSNIPFQPNGFMDGIVSSRPQPRLKRETVPPVPTRPAAPNKAHASNERPNLNLSTQRHKPPVKTSDEKVVGQNAIPTVTPAINQATRKLKSSSRKPQLKLLSKRKIILALVCTSILLNIFLALIALQNTPSTNKPAASQTTNNDEREGKDESNIAQDLVANYTVATDLPRTITIPSLNVKSRILQMGVKPNGQLRAPDNINDAGWYTGSVKPDQQGSLLIDGHVSGPNKPGIFKNIKKLSTNDIIEIDNGAKKVFRYKVEKVETMPKESVDMQKLLVPYNGVDKGLSLITCSGQFNNSEQTFKDRTIVFATQLSETSE